jgi:AraC family transcriptional regulator
VARHFGSRRFNAAAVYVYREWLPKSGAVGQLPNILHYVNVAPDVREGGMITDVYLPVK